VGKQGLKVRQRNLDLVRRLSYEFCDPCPDQRACSVPEDRCAFMHWLAASTASSGVPLKVADPDALAQAALLLGCIPEPSWAPGPVVGGVGAVEEGPSQRAPAVTQS
jgi:hypothetical protein